MKKKLCCVVNLRILCKHCGETFCEDCGGPTIFRTSSGPQPHLTEHFVVGQCRKRYTKEQLKKAERCRNDTPLLSIKWRKPKRPENICDPCKSFYKGRRDRQYLFHNPRLATP